MVGRGAGLGLAAVAEPHLGAGLQPRWDMTSGGAARKAGLWGWCRGHRWTLVPGAVAFLPAARYGVGTAPSCTWLPAAARGASPICGSY